MTIKKDVLKKVNDGVKFNRDESKYFSQLARSIGNGFTVSGVDKEISESCLLDYDLMADIWVKALEGKALTIAESRFFKITQAESKSCAERTSQWFGYPDGSYPPPLGGW
jgi:hypothetical protein